MGVESKVVMAKLQELGEFVRSASSTIEAPVVRKLTDAFQGPGGGSAGKSAAKPSAPRKATPSPAAARPGGGSAPTPGAPARPAASAPESAPAGPVTPAAPATSNGGPAPAAKPSEDISELKSEIEAMRKQLAELSQRK